MNIGPFHLRVDAWMLACFGREIADDQVERNHRFIEESLELVQSLGCTASEAHQLVDYVFGRPVGEPAQECGGVMVTLAALCNAAGLRANECGETELARVWTKVEQIRAKQAAKPKHSPLPEVQAPAPGLEECGYQYLFSGPFGAQVWRDSPDSYNGGKVLASRKIYCEKVAI